MSVRNDVQPKSPSFGGVRGGLCWGRLIVVILFLLCSFSIRAQDKLPQGKWEVKQVRVEKSINDSVQITEYNTVAEMQKYPLPIEWEIKGSQTIVWYYGNGVEQILEYSLEGNDKLQIATTTLQSYQYSINGNTMTLITTNNYKQNLHTGHTEHINEKWTIVLQEKQTK